MEILRKLKWRNVHSGDVGFVKAIREAKGYFENGSVEEAKVYKSESQCKRAITILKKMGEAENNDFIMTTLEGKEVV